MWILILAGVGLAGAYAVSLVRRPYRKCHACSGSGKHGAVHLFPWAHGDCPRCGGKGRFPRLGVRLFQGSRYRQMKGG